MRQGSGAQSPARPAKVIEVITVSKALKQCTLLENVSHIGQSAQRHAVAPGSMRCTRPRYVTENNQYMSLSASLGNDASVGIAQSVHAVIGGHVSKHETVHTALRGTASSNSASSSLLNRTSKAAMFSRTYLGFFVPARKTVHVRGSVTSQHDT